MFGSRSVLDSYAPAWMCCNSQHANMLRNKRRGSGLTSGLGKSSRLTSHLPAPPGIAAEKHASYGIMADASPAAPPCKPPRRVLLRRPELMPCAWPSCVLAASADDVTCTVIGTIPLHAAYL